MLFRWRWYFVATKTISIKINNISADCLCLPPPGQSYRNLNQEPSQGDDLAIGSWRENAQSLNFPNHQLDQTQYACHIVIVIVRILINTALNNSSKASWPMSLATWFTGDWGRVHSMFCGIFVFFWSPGLLWQLQHLVHVCGKKVWGLDSYCGVIIAPFMSMLFFALTFHIINLYAVSIGPCSKHL